MKLEIKIAGMPKPKTVKELMKVLEVKINDHIKNGPQSTTFLTSDQRMSGNIFR